MTNFVKIVGSDFGLHRFPTPHCTIFTSFSLEYKQKLSMVFGLKYEQFITTFINASKQLKRDESAINLIKGYFCERSLCFFEIKYINYFQLNFLSSVKLVNFAYNGDWIGRNKFIVLSFVGT